MPDPESLALARELNDRCHCVALDSNRLCAEITNLAGSGDVCEELRESHPTLFSPLAVFVDPESLTSMAETISAIECVVQSSAYRRRVLQDAPPTAQIDGQPPGIFFGYDFHLPPTGRPQLIEINTNAGGALLNSLLLRAQSVCCYETAFQPDVVDKAIVEMFREEWRSVRGEAPLRSIAIVDDDPPGQYLYPEFLLFAKQLVAHGLEVHIADVRELEWVGDHLEVRGRPVDFVYNRLTDFSLTEPESQTLLRALERSLAVVSPNPASHALYADKRNLCILSSRSELSSLGVSPEITQTLLETVPETVRVTPENAEALWRDRKTWFFKPASGFGSRAAYRGDKLTLRVWAEIQEGGYVAQRRVDPSGRTHVDQSLKVDLRNYVFRGRVFLGAARLYSGQTTNFRTPGGGFAALIRTPESPSMEVVGQKSGGAQ